MTFSSSVKPRLIRLVAPSGYPDVPSNAERGVQRLRDDGHTVDNVAAIERRFERFAGTDGERAADLNGLADTSQPTPDIVMAVRGGYGAHRLLHSLDYAGIQRQLAGRATIIVGFSDFTAIHMALLSQSKLITFAGPMLASNVGLPDGSAFTMSHFWQIVQSPHYTVRGTVPDQPVLDVEGTLWGGNLAMLAALAGTPFLPDIEGGILFIEDIHEQPFRTERMLYQLLLAGVLQKQQAIVMGAFSESSAIAYNNGFTLDSVAEQIARVSGVPVIRGLPFGHIDEIVTLPVGAHARLVSGAAGFAMTMSGYPTLSTSTN